MIRITRADGSEELVEFIGDPEEPKFAYRDVDGDALLVTTALEPDGHRGVYFRTTPDGASVRLEDLPELLDRIVEIRDLQEQRGLEDVSDGGGPAE